MRRVRWSIGVLAAVGLAAACTPPSPSPDPAPPVINAFSAASLRSAAPVTAGYTWNVSDPNGGPLSCTLDVDDDGTVERTISPCDSSNVGTANFTTPGTRTARLTVSDGDFPAVSATTTVSVDPGPSESYAITLRLDPSMPPTYQAAFNAAAARWSQVITAGVPDQYAEIGPVPVVFPWVPPYSGMIDDVLIDARSAPIDGAGQILGHAGALGVRAGGFAYWGVMEFDEADLADLAADGQLNAVILHEMGHILGIGQGWITQNLTTGIPADPRYTGISGNAVWQELGGPGQAPVEDDGGVGTQWVHWREETFGRELMTGYLGAPPSPLSKLTIASLADLGYGVDYSAADPYSLPGGWSYLIDGPREPLRVEWVSP